MPDINNGNVILIGSDNGYLIYIHSNNSIGIVREELEKFSYFIQSRGYLNNPSPNSILHLYDPVNGSHFSLPPAPVFGIKKVIVNKNPHSDHVTVAVACYDDGSSQVNSPNGPKTCIAIVRTGNSEWTRLNLSEVISDDYIEDIVFHLERLYILTNNLKMIVYEGIDDPSSLSEVICMESPAKHVLYKVEEYEIEGKIKAHYHSIPMYYDRVHDAELVQSPDGNFLILCANCIVRLVDNRVVMTFKVFKHDWSRGQWDIVNCYSDSDLSILGSIDRLFIFWKSRSHLVADGSTTTDMLRVYDFGCRRRMSLNIPHSGERVLFLCVLEFYLTWVLKSE